MKSILKFISFILSAFIINGQFKICPKFEENVDFYGNDINFIFTNSAQQCCDQCFSQLNCFGFTFINYTGACWLKSNSTILKLSSIGR